MEEYLSVKELSRRIKMPPGTIRNLIWKKEFLEGTHFVKPTPRKLLFVWSAVEKWLWRGMPSDIRNVDTPKGSINI